MLHRGCLILRCSGNIKQRSHFQRCGKKQCPVFFKQHFKGSCFVLFTVRRQDSIHSTGKFLIVPIQPSFPPSPFAEARMCIREHGKDMHNNNSGMVCPVGMDIRSVVLVRSMI